jgi:hypothetical protein
MPPGEVSPFTSKCGEMGQDIVLTLFCRGGQPEAEGEMRPRALDSLRRDDSSTSMALRMWTKCVACSSSSIRVI